MFQIHTGCSPERATWIPVKCGLSKILSCVDRSHAEHSLNALEATSLERVIANTSVDDKVS